MDRYLLPPFPSAAPARTTDTCRMCRDGIRLSELLFAEIETNSARRRRRLRVWDRRCLFTTGQAAGVLTGHLEGITFIDSRGDGRYLISNGKDQSTKQWDIRKMTSTSPAFPSPRQRDFYWDYRLTDYPEEERNLKHPHDQSVATYKGHSVLYTLIRCYFSPAYSTGQKYIYTGSGDCIVYIYDLVSGHQVARLGHHDEPVRDCSWHPFYPLMVTSSWDGVIAKWELPGDRKEKSSSRPRQGKLS
ncbi:hypothetical protein EUGRSUZ_B01223 [Eucalyptus grandis]|uniref:Uncharacterized protein n=2 Tax=Eucalyptus grandis TaxID=71139 RepID=A0ACC3LPN0_EUCGR|nr:hypothetical protein EUGRSUZ_B01223 [Eucalyptus grandis]